MVSYAVDRSKVFKTSFWMRKHLAATWKRTWVWSTSERIRALDLGRLLPTERETKVKTTVRKRDKDGKMKWQGSRALKGTQHFDGIYYANSSSVTLNLFFGWVRAPGGG